MKVIRVFIAFLLLTIVMVFFGFYSENIFNSTFVKNTRTENEQSEYKIVGKTIWEDDKSNMIEATLLKSAKLPKDLPAGRPAGILEVKNLTTEQLILKEENFDIPISIHSPDIQFGNGKSVFVTWAKGGAEGLQIYSVNSDSAKKIFDKSYRDTYWHILTYEDGKSQSFVFTTDTSLTDNTSLIYKWKWNNTSFDLDGTIKTSNFIRNINKSFVKTEETKY